MATVKQSAGVWACGDRRTAETVQYQTTLADGTVRVVKVEKVVPLQRGDGFIRARRGGVGLLDFQVTLLQLAKLYHGGSAYWIVSESFSSPGDVLPNTGGMVETFNSRQVARLVRGMTKVRTTRLVRGQYVTENHLEPLEAPLARMRLPKTARRTTAGGRR